MKEELQLKVKVDTSNITTTLNKLKNEVSNVENSMNGAAGSSSSMTTSTQKTTQAQTKLTDKVTQMVDRLRAAKNMGFVELVASIAVANKGMETAQQKLRKLKIELAKPGTRMNSKVFDAVQGAIGNITNTNGANPEGFKLITKEMGDALVSLDDFKEKIKDVKSLRGLGKLGDDAIRTGEAAGEAGKGLKSMGVAMKAAGAAATAFAAVLAVVAAALAVVAAGVGVALRVSKLGDEIYHTAHRFNMSTEAFQEWSWVMERAGGSIDDLTGFMETLASEQAAVIEGSEGAIENFKRLGLSADEVVGMRQQELFETTVARIQQISDETERAAIAYSIFGDEASRFMNVLNMSNAEMEEQIKNYHLLGGAMSGELLESSNKLQNSVAGMKQAWQGISNTIAEIFIPIAQKVVEWLTKAFVWVNLFLKVLFGLDLKGSIGGSMDGASSSTDKYAASTKKATKAAEELKRVTMGFDELNIVSNPNKGGADSSASSSPSMGGVGDLGAALPDMSSLNLDGIYAWFEEYKGVIAQITTWSLLLIGILLTVIGCMTMNVPMAAIGIGMAGLGITIGIKSGAFAAAWEAVKKVAIAAGEWIAGIPGWFWESICVPIGEFFVSIGKAIYNTVKAAFLLVVEIIKQYFYDLQMRLEIIWAVIVGAVQIAANTISSAFKLCWTIIKSVWDVVAGYFKAIWDTIKGVFSVVKDVLTGNFKGAWEGIKGIVNTWANFFKGVWTSIKNVFSGVKTFFSDIFKGAFNGVMGIVEKAINAIIKRANKLSWDIPEWVPVIGGGKFGFNFKEISIPRLAQGGIATRSTIANIGEAGKEAILPLENNTEWMDALANKIAERNSAPSKIVLQVGEKELGWATINGINSITKQTGSIQLAL